MAWVNEHFLKLQAGYLFPEIARRVAAYAERNPQARILRMGIGDVTRPLPSAVREALHRAVDEMGQVETFRGYGPEQGYEFLRAAIAEHDYQQRGIAVDADEIFISDGSKCDCGSILDLFGPGNRIAIPDPVYPVYVDTNVMAGNTAGPTEGGRFRGITYLPMTEKNLFQPQPPTEPVDVIYLCSPNNPTGAVMDRPTLTGWVDFARQHAAVIIFDAAYEAYIQDPSLPRSIYEIDGARGVAIELRSFSKTAGFTGLRCAYSVVPKELVALTRDGTSQRLHPLWQRRHATKFNGVAYPIQRAAEATYSPAGRKEVAELIAYYMENARRLASGLRDLGFIVFGGENAPYIWMETSKRSATAAQDQAGAAARRSSWDFFDSLLERCQVVGTPGAGFGAAGEGYFRLSAFGSRETTIEALQRLQAYV